MPFRMSLALTLLSVLAVTAAVCGDEAVSGTFKGNGKPAKLAFASARQGETFADKPTFVIVLTEKDHSKEKRPDFKAGFGDFGSALILTLHPDGKIVGCEVAHAAHDKKPFSSVGKIECTEFKVADGDVTGKVTTKGEVKTFGQTWEVDLTFRATAPK